jgi:hypothetical protein
VAHPALPQRSTAKWRIRARFRFRGHHSGALAVHREPPVVRGNSAHRIRERWLKPLRKRQSGEGGKWPGTRPGPVSPARQQSSKGQRYKVASLPHPAENRFVAVAGSMTTAYAVMLPKGCRGLLGLNGMGEGACLRACCCSRAVAHMCCYSGPNPHNCLSYPRVIPPRVSDTMLVSRGQERHFGAV